jgi:hypothetical protein
MTALLVHLLGTRLAAWSITAATFVDLPASQDSRSGESGLLRPTSWRLLAPWPAVNHLRWAEAHGRNSLLKIRFQPKRVYLPRRVAQQEEANA